MWLSPTAANGPFLLMCWVACSAAVMAAADWRTEDLLRMQEDASDAVIHLNSEYFNRYVSGKSRSYSIVLVLTASHLLDKSNLHLRDLRKQFGTFASRAAQELEKSGHAGKVFFGEIEFNECKDIFQRLSVNMLPLIVRLPGSMLLDPSEAIKLKDEDKMSHNSYPNYPWSANDIAAFVSDRTGVVFPEIKEPTMFERPEFPWIAAASLAVLMVVAYNLYYAEFMKWKGLYMLGSLAVYWFSVSGGMYNIIRSMPMYVPKQDGTFQLFLQGQGQLGAEGFIMGSLYTGCGTSFAICALAATKIKSYTTRRLVCYIFMLAGACCMKGVVDCYRWKTGYGVKTYLFD